MKALPNTSLKKQIPSSHVKRFLSNSITPLIKRRDNRSSSAASGFTLVELLVVIAIIAVLAALSFSVMFSVKEKAHTASCTSNLRQIGIAMISYDSENGRLPGKETGMTWDRAILPYIGYEGDGDLEGHAPMDRSEWADAAATLDIFKCPSDKYQHSPNFFARSYAVVPWTTNWANGTSFRGWKHRSLNRGVPLSIVDAPARAAMVVEWHQGKEGTENCCGSGLHAFHDRGGPDGDDRDVHKRKQNVLFADGHVETLPFMKNSEFVEKYWPGSIGSVD